MSPRWTDTRRALSRRCVPAVLLPRRLHQRLRCRLRMPSHYCRHTIDTDRTSPTDHRTTDLDAAGGRGLVLTIHLRPASDPNHIQSLVHHCSAPLRVHARLLLLSNDAVGGNNRTRNRTIYCLIYDGASATNITETATENMSVWEQRVVTGSLFVP